jgi:hypothetical protein
MHFLLLFLLGKDVFTCKKKCNKIKNNATFKGKQLSAVAVEISSPRKPKGGGIICWWR